MMISILPIEICREIQNFTNINNLLITCKYFEHHKKELYILELNKKYSLKYYNNEEDIRNKIDNNRYKFLSLDLSYCEKIIYVKSLKNVRNLNLSRCINIKDISALEKNTDIIFLNLSYCKNIIYVNKLKNIYDLNLSECENIRDVSALGNVHTLNLSNTNISNVSALGNVHTLNLSGCKNITDVSALENVQILNLTSCKNVIDVSALINVKILDLSYTNMNDKNINELKLINPKIKIKNNVKITKFTNSKTSSKSYIPIYFFLILIIFLIYSIKTIEIELILILIISLILLILLILILIKN